MSPKATEGVAAREALTFFRKGVGAWCRTPPSGLPAISPSRREIRGFADFANHHRHKGKRPAQRPAPFSYAPNQSPT